MDPKEPSHSLGVNIMAIDAVCSMEVEEDHEKYRSCSKGKSYYFCSPGCKEKCDDNPDKGTKLVQDIRGMPEHCE